MPTELKTRIVNLPLEIQRHIKSYLHWIEVKGVHRSFELRLKTHLKYPRDSHGNVYRPTSYFNRRHSRALIRPYQPNKYYFRRCNFRYTYRFETEVFTGDDDLCSTFATIEVYPNFAEHDSRLCSDPMITKLQQLGAITSVSMNCARTSWIECTPTGYFLPEEVEKPKGVAQMMHDTQCWILQEIEPKSFQQNQSV